MNAIDPQQIRAAEVVLPCADLDETLAFFIERLRFRVDEISPADAPSAAVISGYGLRIHLVRGGTGAPGVLRLRCAGAAETTLGAKELVAPNGTRIEIVDADPALDIPKGLPSFELRRRIDDARWG